MDDLIQALMIFRKYTDDKYPTHCEHDELMVSVNPNKVSEDDLKRLEELSFIPNEYECFSSFRFGSC